jgi:lipopolysaccharide transport system ATP-binding protein
MADAARGGRTVVLVSHDTSAIAELCTRCIWLDDGIVRADGDTEEVIAAYVTANSAGATTTWRRHTHATAPVTIESVAVGPPAGEAPSVRYDEGGKVEILYRVHEAVDGAALYLDVFDSLGRVVFQSSETDATGDRSTALAPGLYRSVCWFPSGLIRPGVYGILVAAHVPRVRVLDLVENAVTLEVSELGYRMSRERPGSVTPMLTWETERVSDD